MVAMLMLLPAAGAESAVAQEHPAASPQEIIASAWHPWSRRPDFQRYAGAMARLYQSFGDRLIWLDHGRLSPQGRDAVDQLVAASTQGLRPLEYDAPTLDSLARSRALVSASDEERARFDLLLSLALIRYLDDLHSGRARSAVSAPPNVRRAMGPFRCARPSRGRRFDRRPRGRRPAPIRPIPESAAVAGPISRTRWRRDPARIPRGACSPSR